MSDYETYKRYTKLIDSIAKWRRLGNTQTHSGNNGHTLRIDSLPVKYFNYCGQSCDGAKNYHEPPDAFMVFLADAIKENFDMLYDEAMQKMEAKKQALGKKCLGDLEQMVMEIRGEKAKLCPTCGEYHTGREEICSNCPANGD